MTLSTYYMCDFLKSGPQTRLVLICSSLTCSIEKLVGLILMVCPLSISDMTKLDTSSSKSAFYIPYVLSCLSICVLLPSPILNMLHIDSNQQEQILNYIFCTSYFGPNYSSIYISLKLVCFYTKLFLTSATYVGLVYDQFKTTSYVAYHSFH